MLQYYPPSGILKKTPTNASEDESIRALLHKILQTIMQTTTTVSSTSAPKNIQQSNAQNAVLFEAINLAIHLAAIAEGGRPVERGAGPEGR